MTDTDYELSSKKLTVAEVKMAARLLNSIFEVTEEEDGTESEELYQGFVQEMSEKAENYQHNFTCLLGEMEKLHTDRISRKRKG